MARALHWLHPGPAHRLGFSHNVESIAEGAEAVPDPQNRAAQRRRKEMICRIELMGPKLHPPLILLPPSSLLLLLLPPPLPSSSKGNDTALDAKRRAVERQGPAWPFLPQALALALFSLPHMAAHCICLSASSLKRG
jgi:hypothetical protein